MEEKEHKVDNEDSLEFVVRLSDHIDAKDFNLRCENFFKDNCHVVDLQTDEHSHEYFELYKQYTEILDEMLEGFLDNEGLTKDEMFRKLKYCYDTNVFASEYIDFVLAITNYEGFAKCLKDHWRAFAKNNNLLPSKSAAVSSSPKTSTREGKSNHK